MDTNGYPVLFVTVFGDFCCRFRRRASDTFCLRFRRLLSPVWTGLKGAVQGPSPLSRLSSLWFPNAASNAWRCTVFMLVASLCLAFSDTVIKFDFVLMTPSFAIVPIILSLRGGAPTAHGDKPPRPCLQIVIHSSWQHAGVMRAYRVGVNVLHRLLTSEMLLTQNRIQSAA